MSERSSHPSRNVTARIKATILLNTPSVLENDTRPVHCLFPYSSSPIFGNWLICQGTAWQLLLLFLYFSVCFLFWTCFFSGKQKPRSEWENFLFSLRQIFFGGGLWKNVKKQTFSWQICSHFIKFFWRNNRTFSTLRSFLRQFS